MHEAVPKPTIVLYLPATQDIQTSVEAVVTVEYFPAIHAVLTPPVQKYPAPQVSAHVVDLPAIDQVPSKQAPQVADEEAVVAVEYFPAGHAVLTPPVQ